MCERRVETTETLKVEQTLGMRDVVQAKGKTALPFFDHHSERVFDLTAEIHSGIISYPTTSLYKELYVLRTTRSAFGAADIASQWLP